MIQLYQLPSLMEIGLNVCMKYFKNNTLVSFNFTENGKIFGFYHIFLYAKRENYENIYPDTLGSPGIMIKICSLMPTYLREIKNGKCTQKIF